jgi:hypothetical protein
MAVRNSAITIAITALPMQRRRLAAAARPRQRDDLAGRYVERDIVERAHRLDRAAGADLECLGDLLQPDARRLVHHLDPIPTAAAVQGALAWCVVDEAFDVLAAVDRLVTREHVLDPLQLIDRHRQGGIDILLTHGFIVDELRTWIVRREVGCLACQGIGLVAMTERIGDAVHVGGKESLECVATRCHQLAGTVRADVRASSILPASSSIAAPPRVGKDVARRSARLSYRTTKLGSVKGLKNR